MTLSSFSCSVRFGRRAVAAFLVLAGLQLATPSRALAADDPPRELDEHVSSQLEKLKPLLDAKDWDGALNLLNGIIPTTKPDSYDRALLADIIGKLYLQKNDFAKAIAPMEEALRLGDAHKYFDKTALQDSVYYLAQLYYQEATGSKNHAVQKRNAAKAISYLERWLADTTKAPFDQSRAEATLLYANLLYFDATIDQNHIDRARLKQAEQQIEANLHMSLKPKENAYLILLAIYQQQERYEPLADVLELLVKEYPNKKDYWSQLVGVYGTLAANALTAKDDRKYREYNIRTILAIERAQALGFMKAPKDNYALFGVYFNVGQFGKAIDILQAGLRNGSIESDVKNWELLANSYQQIDKPLLAIAALKDGAKRLPRYGELDYQIATIYYSLNKPEDAFKYTQDAIEKNHLEKPGAVYGFMAYVAWELNKYPEALAAVDKALGYPDSAKDTQLPKLKAAIEDALRTRQEKTAAKTA